MKRILLILTLCLIGLMGLAQAQDVPVLSNLEISVWPEFDRPDVLVIYRGLFAADTPLPMSAEIRIPARVGQPTAVAYVGEGGQRLNQQYTTRVEGDWLVVSFELATEGFQLEYYDPLSIDSSGQRQYSYSYTADYPVEALSLEVQVPPTAQDFTLEPPADSVTTQTDGLVYHLISAGTLDQGEERGWTFAYQKDNDNLTAAAFAPAETAVPAAVPVAESTDNSTVLIFLVAFVALFAVGAGAFWLGRGTQSIDETEPSASRQQKRRGSGRGVETQRRPSLSSQSSDILFCRQCGTDLRPDSDFCHRCGAQVPKE
jgi:hypothetical protein